MGLYFWPILWITFAVGLVIATIVVAVKESSAKAKAAKQLMATQAPMPMGDAPGAEPAPDDGFGDAGQVEFGAFDENAFK